VLLNSYSLMKKIRKIWMIFDFEVKFRHFLTPPHYTNLQNSMISFDCRWFRDKKLSNFVYLPWKLHNRYWLNENLSILCITQYLHLNQLIAMPILSANPKYFTCIIIHIFIKIFLIGQELKSQGCLSIFFDTFIPNIY
jgi:hypothetical protein